MDNGWIKLHRSLLEWEWYDDINTMRLFVHLILKANHKPKKYKGKNIGSGQVITGRKLLSQETRLTQQQIRTCLSKLKSTNEITIKADGKGSVIQIVNYRKYQQSTNKTTSNQPTNNQPTTNKQPTDNQPITTNKKEKKEKKEKNNEVTDYLDGCNFISTPLKKHLAEYFDFLKNNHNRDIGAKQAEQAIRMLTSWYNSDSGRINCLSTNILSNWKILRHVSSVESEENKTTPPYYKDLS